MNTLLSSITVLALSFEDVRNALLILVFDKYFCLIWNVSCMPLYNCPFSLLLFSEKYLCEQYIVKRKQ